MLIKVRGVLHKWVFGKPHPPGLFFLLNAPLGDRGLAPFLTGSYQDESGGLRSVWELKTPMRLAIYERIE